MESLAPRKRPSIDKTRTCDSIDSRAAGEICCKHSNREGRDIVALVCSEIEEVKMKVSSKKKKGKKKAKKIHARQTCSKKEHSIRESFLNPEIQNGKRVRRGLGAPWSLIFRRLY